MGFQDQLLVIHGRKPVLEALNGTHEVVRVHLSPNASGKIITEIEHLARSRDVSVERVTDNRINALTRSGQHQGVAADIRAKKMQSLPSFLEQRTGRKYASSVLVLDGIHNPANLGMILRSVTAAGLDGVVVPYEGTAKIGAVAIKASAGVAFKAPILRIDNAVNAVTMLRDARFSIIALDSGGESALKADYDDRVALVLGNETNGIQQEVLELCQRTLSLPLHNGVESLNAAVAASVISYLLMGRKEED
ncbi:MAG: RNA methyltransferase [Acidimicrobiaceae bacterium]|nr:RNA methyltransferase [Acidimicrobiaceae bacterium]